MLLRTTIDTDIFGHVDRTGENIRRHSGHHRNVYVQILFQFRTVDCIVGSDVEIVCKMCIRDSCITSPSI